MATYLTKVLIVDSWYANPNLESESWFEVLTSTTINDLEFNLEKLKEPWKWLQENVWAHPQRKLGARVMASMIAACVDRLEHPGELALAHRYSERLCGVLPLPLIM